jgi:hypothetical protein
MKPEIINPTELVPQNKSGESAAEASEFTPQVASSLFESRLAEAEQLQPFISLKFYYFLKEKIVREQAAARKLLTIEENKQEVLDKYSFILNPAYFEQKLIS